MNNGTRNGRGPSPADPFRYLRRLYPRGLSTRQKDRTLDLMRQLALQPTDSVFALIALLEAYLSMIEQACQSVSRSTRRILLRSCVAAIVSGCLFACPLLVVAYHFEGLLDRELSNASKTDEDAHQSPFHAFVAATTQRMTEAEAQRIATSVDAMTILKSLGQASDDQLRTIRNYLSHPTQPAR